MQVVKKIRFKLFIPLSLLATIALALFLDNEKQVAALFLIYLSTLLWLASMMYMVGSLLSNNDKTFKVDWFKAVLALIFKLVLFAGILYIGWQLMGKKLFIALLNLPIQTIVLAISARTGFKDN